MDRPLAGRIALVTGASRGIGRATALALAKAGAHVIAIARTEGGLTELDDEIRAATGESATLVPLDVKDGDGLDRLAAAIWERWKKLDILVANAATLGPISPLAHVEVDHWDHLIAVNITATWRVIRAMDPLLRASDAGRVVLLSSGVAQSPRAYWGPYALTKAAVDCMGRTYAAEVATTPVKVNLFNPGPTRTKMRATAMPGEDPETLPPPEAPAEKIVEMCLPSFTDSGRIYEFKTRTLKSFQPPV
jgi:NAD(P)-dependent dehydrogenase (short-subunit alcohol dehydrogenase family)